MEETEKKDESKTEEEVKPEATAPDKSEGDKPKESNFIDDTNLASKRMEEANKERLKILEEETRLWSEQKLAGVSGSATPVENKKETEEEYAERFAKGEVNLFDEDGTEKT